MHSDLEYLFIYMASVEFGLVNVIQVSAFTSLITWQSKTKSTECVVFMCGFKKNFKGEAGPRDTLFFRDWVSKAHFQEFYITNLINLNFSGRPGFCEYAFMLSIVLIFFF